MKKGTKKYRCKTKEGYRILLIQDAMDMTLYLLATLVSFAICILAGIGFFYQGGIGVLSIIVGAVSLFFCGIFVFSFCTAIKNFVFNLLFRSKANVYERFSTIL